MSCSGEAGAGEPEVLDRLHHGEEVIEIERLRYEAVRVQLVRARDVGLGSGGSEDDDRYAAQVGVAFELLQDLSPVLLREVEVEQDEIRPRTLGVLAFAAQEGHRLLTVAYDSQPRGAVAVLEHLTSQP